MSQAPSKFETYSRLMTLHTEARAFIILSILHSSCLHPEPQTFYRDILKWALSCNHKPFQFSPLSPLLPPCSKTVSSSASFLLLKMQPPGLVSKNNVRFVSKNPWYVLATSSKNSAFSPVVLSKTDSPCTHLRAHTRTHCKAVSLCSPLSCLSFVCHSSFCPFLLKM